jgi:hypothetical protein
MTALRDALSSALNPPSAPPAPPWPRRYATTAGGAITLVLARIRQ